MTTFKQLGLRDEILTALTDIGFEKPTDIQNQSIPNLLNGEQDFLGLAQTGTGKTAAFGLPLLQLIDTGGKFTQALILAPTRELGQQIAEQMAQFSKHMDRLHVVAVYGGASISHQIKQLQRNPQIIVATPGRLIDLMNRKALRLNKIKYLILDEADEMLNMGFKEELDQILDKTPEEKLTWLFAATMPQEIKRIVKKYMDDPIEVRINQKNIVNTDISHKYTVVKRDDKTEALKRFLDIDPDMKGVVFCRTKRETQALSEELIKQDYKVDAIHGDLSQQQRDKVMRRFKSHSLKVLIATDVAARGIDVNSLTHVFHFTLPDDNSYYTHRSGRTARAGKKGVSIAFVGSRETRKIERLERELNISFEKVNIASTEDIAFKRVENWCLTVLDKKTKGSLDPEILERAITLFGNLSKEELIAKVLMFEIEKLISPSSGKDLNDRESFHKKSKSRRSRSKGKFSHKREKHSKHSFPKKKKKHSKRKKQKQE